MCRIDVVTDCTSRLVADFFDAVCAIRRAGWNLSQRVHPDIRGKIAIEADGVARFLVVLESELIGGVTDLVEIVDAGVGLGGGAGPDHVWDGDRGQQTDDGDNNHYFHQGKTLMPDDCFRFFHVAI